MLALSIGRKGSVRIKVSINMRTKKNQKYAWKVVVMDTSCRDVVRLVGTDGGIDT